MMNAAPATPAPDSKTPATNATSIPFFLVFPVPLITSAPRSVSVGFSYLIHGQATYNVIPRVKLDEADDFGCGFSEALVGAAVAVPVEHQMCRQNAAAGNRGDIGHILK